MAGMDKLKIIRLEASNVKRIKAVEISPKGEVIEIAGRNGQGKTSVLDSILWALGGGREIQWQPIRAGEAKAKIVLDLGDMDGVLQLQVTRTFNAKDGGDFTTALKVTNADGFKPDAPQDMLTALVGALSFDPGEFIRAKASDQISTLKGIIERMDPDADFASIEKRKKAAFDERTDVTREEKRNRAQAAAFVVGDDYPKETIDISALMDSVTQAAELGRAYDRMMADRESRQSSIARLRDAAEEARARAVELDKLADAQQADFDELVEPVAPPDVSEIRTAIADGERHNNLAAVRRDRDAAVARADAFKAEAEGLTETIAECEAEIRELIERAHLPVSGLELGPDCVMLRGVPFNQASDAEQLRASMALAIAANPRLRVIRIRDGSLLDVDAMAVIREVAADSDFQIWMERVGEGSGTGETIVMENGEVRSDA